MTNSAIVLVVDRLGAGCLGPYGNTWAPTPNFNALAAKSLLLDNCLTDSPELLRAYRGYWQGRHALESDADESIVSSIAAAGAKTVLVTDDPQLAQSPESDTFDEKLLLDLDAPQASAADVEQTNMATFFAEGIETLQTQQEPFLLWMHSRGLGAPWDAPRALRQSLADEEDPEPLETIDVPSLRLEANYDPDQLLGITQAHAAQVLVLDECLGVLMQAIEQHPHRNELLTVVTSTRGFPLGEHLVVGDFETQLHGELLHVPLFLWRGDGQGALLRSHVLTQPPDVGATIRQWFTGKAEDDNAYAQSFLTLTTVNQTEDSRFTRDRIVSITDSETAIRTPAWFLRTRDESEVDGDSHELYRKPDDRWELNEVASRCPQIVEQLMAAIDATHTALASGKLNELPILEAELLEGLE